MKSVGILFVEEITINRGSLLPDTAVIRGRAIEPERGELLSVPVHPDFAESIKSGKLVKITVEAV